MSLFQQNSSLSRVYIANHPTIMKNALKIMDRGVNEVIAKDINFVNLI